MPAMGWKPESDAALAQHTNDHADDDAYGIAEGQAYFGDVDRAFGWLDRAYR